MKKTIIISFSFMALSVCYAQELKNKDIYLQSCIANINKDVAIAGDDLNLKAKLTDELTKKCECLDNNLDFNKINAAIKSGDTALVSSLEDEGTSMCTARRN